MKRIPLLLLLAFAGLTLAGCASAPSEEPLPSPEEPAAEAACTAWILDITNRTGREVQIYEYRGEELVDPRYLPSKTRLKGHLVKVVLQGNNGSSLLFGAQPSVMIYAFQEARNAQTRVVVDSTSTPRYEEVAPDRPEQMWLLGLASPDEQRWVGTPRGGLHLRYTCATD